MGEPMGRPFAEWAYVTPRYPEGLTATELSTSTQDLQRETGIIWFLSNLRPYNLAGGPWLHFDAPGKGWNQGYWAPSPLKAAPILRQEFGQVLGPEVIAGLADSLQGDWMWVERGAAVFAVSSDVPQDRDEVVSGILARLDGIEAALNALAPAHGSIGHNRPPEDLPLAEEDREAGLAAVATIREAAANAFRVILPAVKAAIDRLSKIMDHAGRFLLAQASTFCTAAATAAGAAEGAALQPEIHHYAAELWHNCQHLFALLERVM